MTRRPQVLFTAACALALGASFALAAGCSPAGARCDPPLTVCSPTVCANLDTDPQHCGSCGNACGVGQVCSKLASEQVATCKCPGEEAGTQKMCDGVCMNVKTDPKNCGTCGKDCGADLCIDGTCGCPNKCNDVCTDLAVDPKNCGTCGKDCGALDCAGGQCGCAAGRSEVGGTCSATVVASCFNGGSLVALGDDLRTQAQKAVIGAGPQSIAWDGARFLVADTIDSALYSVDPKLAPIARAAGADRLSKQVNHLLVKGTKAYAVCSGDNVVQVLDLSQAAPASGVTAARSVDEIPTTLAAAPENTNPSFAAFVGDKLYVTLLGTCDATGDAAGNRLLELDVSTVPGKVTRELAFAGLDFDKDAGATGNSPRPAGLAAVGTKLYVAIGNLAQNCLSTAGPGYLAIVDTAADPMTFQKLKLPDECRNPSFVLSTATRVYVTCLGAYGNAATAQESLLVVDPTTDTVIKTTTFARCADPFEAGPNACKTAVPGRMALHGDKLLVADNNAGRLLVTDLEGNVAAGFESGVALCPLECKDNYCWQFVGDVSALR